MSALLSVLRDLAGLFVDDGALALSLVAVIVIAAVTAAMMPGTLAAGVVLVAGCIGTLVVNVLRTARR